ncbi:hypothetical protein CDO44_04050 [Pigmentiphaga sp. NML080357]|nr:hypothetical protein CDO44_04050 [Pigmentiphaga sp. NML080357]
MSIARIALLVDAYEQPGWVCDLIEWIVQRRDFELAAILVAPHRPIRAGWTRRNGPLMKALIQMEQRVLTERQRALLKSQDIRLLPSVESKPIGLWPKSNAAEALRGLELDLIIAPDGLPVARDQLQGAARIGTWCLSYCATDAGSGRYAGFWEVLRRADHTVETLWWLAERPEDDEPIEKRSFNTEAFWLKNQARAFDLGKLIICDALCCLAVAAPQRYTDPVPRIDTALPTGHPTEWDGASYLARQVWLAAVLTMRRLMNRNMRWRIGMFPSMGAQAMASDALVLTPPKGRFFADPFVHMRDNRPYIFFEDYDFNERKGRIAVATYRDGRFELLGDVLNLPYHLSFPFVFEYQGATYMVPETCGNRSIELWKCEEFPMKWKLECTLMRDISAVDTIVFQHGEYWWLLTNIDRTDGLSHCDELFAFYASSPTATDWRPHAANPVVRSPAKARNAGLVVSPSGDIIRCAQYQGFCQYGKGISLNRIEKLTPLEYRESDGTVHYAQFVGKNNSAMHHWHSHGGHTVFDFAYME